MNGQSTDRPLYNSRIVDTYIKLLKARYPQVSIKELLEFAGMKPYEVADQGHWFTQEQIDRFHLRMEEATDNRQIAKEAGRYAASPQSLGAMRQYALSHLEPGRVFGLIRQASANFTRSSTYEARRLSSREVEIVVTPAEGVAEKPFQCQNRMGFFEAILLMFNHRLSHLAHPECIFKGDPVCRYVVTWEKDSDLWQRLRTRAALVLLPTSALAWAVAPPAALNWILPLAALAVLAPHLFYYYLEKRESRSALLNLKEATDSLIDQINLNYNNTLLANEIGQAISRHTQLDDLLANLVQIMENRLDYERGLILLTDPEQGRLAFRIGFGYTEEQLGLLQKVTFHLDRPESRGVFVVSLREQKPFLINDLDEIEEDLSPRSLAFARKLGVQSFICCPILCDGDPIGILAADNPRSGRPLVQSDMSLLMGVASFIGISIHNIELLEASHRQSRSVLQILASSIDARDPLTAGHSEKVTEYALGICQELNLPQNFREMIRVAALLHDYGKIGVPDSILKKEGRLTPEEYEIVKTHSRRTREILEQINFKGIFRQVPEVAAAHHEKLDGSGYPLGLKGKDIPLGARVIAVADYFEAITAKRHYREPMPLDEAFKVLREGSGVHFEERLVEALISYFTKTYACPLDLDPEPSSQPLDRRLRRIPFRAEVALEINGAVASGTSADLSEHGIYVAVKEEVRPGSEVALAFALPDHEGHLIRARGRVAWVNNRRERRKPIFPVGIGVEFTDLREPGAKALHGFVSQRLSVEPHRLQVLSAGW